MKKIGILVILISVLIQLIAVPIVTTLPPVSAESTQTTVTLSPVSDATINSLSSNINFGHDHTLKVQYHSTHLTERALIRFNLAAAVPSDAVVDVARLELFLEGKQGPDFVNLVATCLTTDWVEGEVTWNNPPATGSPAVATLVDTSVSTVRLDVTDIVRAWHNAPHYGLQVSGPEGETTYDLCFESREHEERPPQLVVTYRLPTVPAEGWCCLDGEVFASTEEECLKGGGQFFATEEEAVEACQAEPESEGWCCLDGEVTASTQEECLEGGGHFFATEEEAENYCQGEVPGQLPDLIVTAGDRGAIIPSPPLTDRATVFEVLVENTGSAPVDESFTLELYVDGNLQHTWTFLPVSEEEDPAHQYNPLMPGGSRIYDCEKTFQAGQHSLRWVVDAGNEIEESNEGNNELKVTANWQSAPDLVVEDISPVGAPAGGQASTWNVKVKNIGKGDASGPFLTTFWPEGIAGGVQENFWTQSLPAAQSATFQTTQSFKSWGELRITVTVDASYVITEALPDGEDNNELVKKFDLAFVDLEVENLAIKPNKIAAHEPADLSFTVSNIGTADALQPFKVKLFPGKVSGGLTQPKLLTVQKLGAGESIGFQYTVNLLPGDYQVSIEADYPSPNPVYFEPDRNNNVLAQSIHVYTKKEAFLVSDRNWKDVLRLVSLTTWTDPKVKEQVHKHPTLIFHLEDNDAFDADAVVHFLQQYEPSRLSIFGDTRISQPDLPFPGANRQTLESLLVANEPTGAGLQAGQIAKYDMDGYLYFWASIDKVVVSEDDYETGLMASVFASYLNAPLVFDDEQFDPTVLDGRQAYAVGDIRQTTKQEIENRAKRPGGKTYYTLEELRKAYATWTATDKVILVNPADLGIMVNKDYRPDKSSTISDLYGHHSLAAPFLAAAKHELIISTTANSYLGVDSYVENTLGSLNLPGELTYLTIVASPVVVPIARENRDTSPALWGNKAVFEEINPSKIDSVALEIVVVTYDTSTGTVGTEAIASTGADGNLDSPAIYEDKIVWGEWGELANCIAGCTYNWDIYLYRLATNNKERITTDVNGQKNPAIYENTIVWQDNRNGHWDIYMYDVLGKTETRITTDTHDQINPAIYGDKIVWQDNRNNVQWDIYMYDLSETDPQKRESRITTGGGNAHMHPAIDGNVIVWQDKRNDHWDIYMYDINQKQQIRITTDPGHQISPSISGNRVVWEDRRHENSCVYIYDIVTKTETQLTTGHNKQTRPAIQGNHVIWYSEGKTSIPPAHVAPSAGAHGGRWLTYFHNVSTGVTMSPYHNLLSHQYSTCRQEVDGRYYGSLVNYGKQDRAVGRIMGISTSDVSAYIARAVFFDDIKPNKKDALLMIREDRQDETVHWETDGPTLYDYATSTYWTGDVPKQFDTVHFYAGGDKGASQAPAVNQNIATIQGLYDDCYLIIYVDHGGSHGFDNVVNSAYLRKNDVALLPSIVLDTACATCTALFGYYPAWNTAADGATFCIENIRRGAMVYMGAVDVSYWHRMYDNILEGIFVDGKTIGEVYVEGRNEEYTNCMAGNPPWPCGDSYYALIGDPTFRPRWW